MPSTPTNTATKAPNSLKGWRQLLQPHLPANPSIKQAALHKLKASTGNTTNVAAILQHDPALCLLLFHAANKGLSRGTNQALSPAHTISLLGFPKVIDLISRAPDWKTNPFPQLKQYQQQLNISLHGARLAHCWAELNPHWSTAEVFWPALFLQAPLWALWYQAGDTQLSLQQQQLLSAGASHSRTEQKLLGCSIQQLSLSLSQDWYLPKLCTQARELATAGSSRQWLAISLSTDIDSQQSLQKIATQPSFLIALANRLASEYEWNGYSRQSLRLQKILAAVLKKPVPAMINLIHQQTIDSGRQTQISGSFNPALQLFSFYQKAPPKKIVTHSTRVKPATKPNTATNTASSNLRQKQAPHTVVSDGFNAAIKQLEQAKTFNNLQQLINFVVQQLQQQAGFERTTALLLNRKTKTLETRCSSGCEQSLELQQYTHLLRQGDLFNKLLQKTLSLHLQASNYKKIWPLLPGSFKQACASNEFMMMSIIVAGKPIGLIYADCGNNTLSEQQYDLFKQLCNAGRTSLKILLAKPNKD